MAIRPANATFTNVSADVLNAIRNSASQNYRDYVPYATSDPQVLRGIGQTMMDNPAIRNEFVNTLMGAIARTYITSKMYQSPWNIFKKGLLQLGETVQEVFVELAKPHTYDPQASVSNLYAREDNDVRVAYHIMNYQKFYKKTISREELGTAFTSVDGVTNLINKIIETMYTSAEYDEFQTMKYLLGIRLLNGQLIPKSTSAVSAQNAKSIVTDIKAVSGKMEYMNSVYNIAGVHNHTARADQYVLMSTDFEAITDVEVLASAFNMSKVEFMGHRIGVDGFGTMDMARLNELFAGDPNYHEFTSDELAALNAIPCVIVDEDFFQIYDNLIETGEEHNAEGLYWNYFLHRWATFGVSPFSQAVVFVPATPAITSVDVSPATATITASATENKTLQATATVVATNFAPKSVVWSSSDTEGEDVIVDERGLITVLNGATAGEYTITATSTYDATKSDTCVITVS